MFFGVISYYFIFYFFCCIQIQEATAVHGAVSVALWLIYWIAASSYRYYIHFWTNTLGKGMYPSIPLAED